MRSGCNVILIIFLSFFSLQSFSLSQDFPTLERLQNQGAKVSALVVNLNTGKTIAQLSLDQRLSPASVSKLVIGADALETWGPGKTFTSQIFIRGRLKDHVLYGDLIFYGQGDPSLTNEKLWFLTTDVARYGINKVTGKIIVNKSYFGDIKADENRNHGLAHSKNAYDAPLSSAAINFSVLAMVVSATQNTGEKANIAIEPYQLPSVKIINHVTTIKAGPSKVLVQRDSKNGFDIFTVSGDIAINSPMIRVYRSISNADNYAGEVISAFLNHAGIQTSGQVEVENKALKNTDVLVSEVQSFPLAWQLRGLFEMSNNFIADMLYLKLNNLENYMQQVIPNSSGAHSHDTDIPITLHSGSGLTPENRLSARDVVTLLSRMYSKGNLFPEFISALAIPGEAGSLKNRFHKLTEEPVKLMLRAKTGTLTEPLDVVALAGYSRLKNGDWIAFAFIVNGSPKNSSFGIENIRSAVDSDLLQILSSEQK